MQELRAEVVDVGDLDLYSHVSGQRRRPAIVSHHHQLHHRLGRRRADALVGEDGAWGHKDPDDLHIHGLGCALFVSSVSQLMIHSFME